MGLGYYARNGTGLATKGLVGLRSGMRASNSQGGQHQVVMVGFTQASVDYNGGNRSFSPYGVAAHPFLDIHCCTTLIQYQVPSVPRQRSCLSRCNWKSGSGNLFLCPQM